MSSADKDPLLLQAMMTGYFGKAANLYAALDPDSGLLLIAGEKPPGELLEGAFVITNDPRAEQRDALFSEELLADAIQLYFRARANEMIEWADEGSTHDPTHKIQLRGMGADGARYEVGQDVTNGQMAVLALAWVADRAFKAQSTANFADEIAELFLSI